MKLIDFLFEKKLEKRCIKKLYGHDMDFYVRNGWWFFEETPYRSVFFKRGGRSGGYVFCVSDSSYGFFVDINFFDKLQTIFLNRFYFDKRR